MVLYSEFTYGSQFSEEKNGLEIRLLVPEIFNKYKRSILFGTPCIFNLTLAWTRLSLAIHGCQISDKVLTDRNRHPGGKLQRSYYLR